MMRQAAHNSLPYSTGEAIALLKEKRSVLMSAEQVHMLGRLYGDLTSQESMDRVDLPASFPCPRIMCVGLPCSGKSHFISMLMRAFGAQRVWRASQDELGRDECQSLWAQYPEPGCVCVLDRCNLTAAERRVWLDLCHKSPTVCMFFNINSTTCIERSVSRDIHPTLPAARAPRIIQSLAAQLEPPTLGEGFCSLHEITCDEDLQLLLRKMGVLETKSQFSDEVVPFPRTTHLINLGAATEDDQVLVKRDGRAADEAVENLFAEAFKIGARIVVEEKVDGANMGIRLMSDGSIGVQNRSHFVTCKSGEQFKRLDWWIEQHTEQLHALLNNPRWVLYGEWMLMKHSVYYDRLPDIFLAFDLYDRASKAFMSREFLQRRLEESAAKCCCSAANAIKQVPLVAAFASPTDLLTAKSVKQVLQ
jgi:atypical dual specificity phosphatase